MYRCQGGPEFGRSVHHSTAVSLFLVKRRTQAARMIDEDSRQTFSLQTTRRAEGGWKMTGPIARGGGRNRRATSLQDASSRLRDTGLALAACQLHR